MVFSRVQGKASADLTKLSGHAYMSGADSWVDLERMLGRYNSGASTEIRRFVIHSSHLIPFC